MGSRSLRELRTEMLAGPPYADSWLAALRIDPRAGARALYQTCLRHQERLCAEEARLESMMHFEREAQANGFTRVAGVDEAGRGPLAGPIIAGAVVLADGRIPGLNDSKQLTANERERLFAVLQRGAHSIAFACVDAETIDRMGIQSANYAAMAQAAAHLEPAPNFLLVDGFRIHGCPTPQNPLVKGDQRSLSIAAASIVAKVIRDRIMIDLDLRYPQYHFAENKGYATPEHLAALREFGPCPFHRKSFAPLAQAGETCCLFEEARH